MFVTSRSLKKLDYRIQQLTRSRCVYVRFLLSPALRYSLSRQYLRECTGHIPGIMSLTFIIASFSPFPRDLPPPPGPFSLFWILHPAPSSPPSNAHRRLLSFTRYPSPGILSPHARIGKYTQLRGRCRLGWETRVWMGFKGAERYGGKAWEDDCSGVIEVVDSERVSCSGYVFRLSFRGRYLI